MQIRRLFAVLLAAVIVLTLAACGTGSGETTTNDDSTPQAADNSQSQSADTTVIIADSAEKADIESALNLANIKPEWTYSENADAWTMAIVTAVTNAELPDYQGVSVCVPGAYVKGVDTDSDGTADVTSGTASGNLVIDYDATVTSTNGQVNTAATAPVIINTGAAGYSAQSNQTAGTTYAKEGYINIACGNRGKQDSYTDESGQTVYTGDAPSCLADQKAAARFVKYNILLGNLPGSVDYWVSTGGSGGGAHAVMFAATSNHPDFYDYQIEVGAVGVYRNADGSYDTTVTIDGEQVELSDGAWGCVGYSPITSLYEADMAMAFEYSLDPDYSFNTEFQKTLASCLSQEYMEYVNSQGWTFMGVPMSIEYDAESGAYAGSYVDMYRSWFINQLNEYLSQLDYADGWTWFDSDGNTLSDAEFQTMTLEDKMQAFIEGRYDKGSSGRGGMMGGMLPSGMNGRADFGGGRPDFANGEMPDFGGRGGMGDVNMGPDAGGDEMLVGTPDQGTTQASGSATDSKNYAAYEDMLAAYAADIAELEAGDRFSKNPVDLYNPLNYIGAEGTENPAWMVLLCGAAEGDISMLNSMNIEIAAQMAGIDAEAQWQWDGGHVPSEIFGSSLALRVDQMYGEYAENPALTGEEITKSDAELQTENGSAESPAGTDLTSWVRLDEDGGYIFSLEDIAAYRTAAASKATPGFDVIDYGQEDYVFGDSDTDARHWSPWVYRALSDNRDILEPLFNQ